MTDLIAIPQKHSDVLAGAWCSHDRQLAERWSQAMKKACAEKRDHFSAALKEAWASDPELRAQFGHAVSMGLRRLWANAAVRAQQSERIKQTYERGDLRKRRSERLKKNWASADFRQKMLRTRGRAGEQPKERAS
jgi:hypothetical protein